MYYIYIVECNDNTLYTGFAADIKKRIMVHNSGKGAKYTRGRIPVTLRYYETFDTKGDALRREREIKGLARNKKLELIAGFNKNIDV